MLVGELFPLSVDIFNQVSSPGKYGKWWIVALTDECVQSIVCVCLYVYVRDSLLRLSGIVVSNDASLESKPRSLHKEEWLIVRVSSGHRQVYTKIQVAEESIGKVKTLAGHRCWLHVSPLIHFTVTLVDFEHLRSQLWYSLDHLRLTCTEVCWAAVMAEKSRRCDAGVRGEAAEARVRQPTLPLLFRNLSPISIARVEGGGGSYLTGGSAWHLPCPGELLAICPVWPCGASGWHWFCCRETCWAFTICFCVIYLSKPALFFSK